MPEEEEVVGRRKVRRRGKGAINVVVVADGGSGSVDAVKDDKGGVTQHACSRGVWSGTTDTGCSTWVLDWCG